MLTSRPTRTAGIALASAICVWAGTAHAQGLANPNLPRITLSAQARYETNVSGTSATQAALRGLTQADEHLLLNADLNLERRLGIFDASLIGGIGYNFYAKNSQLNRERINLQGAVLAKLSRCSVNLTSELHRGQSDLTDVAFLPGTVRQDIKNVETRVQYGAEVGCGGDIGLQPVLGITRETGTNTADTRKYSNFRRTDYLASLRYAQPVFGEVSLIGVISNVDNPNRPPVGGRVDGYQAKIIGVRFKREIGANLSGTVQINYDKLNPRRNVRPFSGVTYSGSITATFVDRLQLTALLLRDTKPALQSDAAYSVVTSYQLDATYAASDRLSFGVGGGYDISRYPGAGVLGGPALNNNRRKTANANVTFRASDRIRFGVDAFYTSRDADGNFYDSDNTGGGISASLAL